MVFNGPSSPVSTDSDTDSDTESRGKIGFCGIFPRMGFAWAFSPASTDSDTESRGTQKLVVKVELHDNRDRSKAMVVVSGFGGVGSLIMDMKDSKLTVSGDFNPVKVVNKLRKSWHTQIVSVGPAKEGDGKKDEGKKNQDLIKAHQAYYSPPLTYSYYVPHHEEPPIGVIC